MTNAKLKIQRPYQRTRVPTKITDPSRAKQSFKAECDINNIMAKYQKTGAVSHFAKNSPRYGDATGADFHTAMNLVTETQQLFLELPSSIRNRFGNDPSAFLDFVQNPDNRAEMVEMGLRERSAPEKAKLAADEPAEAQKPPEAPPETGEVQ